VLRPALEQYRRELHHMGAAQDRLGSVEPGVDPSRAAERQQPSIQAPHERGHRRVKARQLDIDRRHGFDHGADQLELALLDCRTGLVGRRADLELLLDRREILGLLRRHDVGMITEDRQRVGCDRARPCSRLA
jgi:hypothetical protein